jgi:hypothetical protein
MKLPVVLPVALGIACVISAYPAWWPEVVGAPPPTAIDTDRTPLGIKVPADTIVDFRVTEWNDTSSDAKVLEVKKSGNEWSIPSKFDYPADANARVSTAAATYLGLERGRFVTDDPAQYEALGVLDPLDPDITKRKGRGKRVTLTDATGKVVADLVIGERCAIGDGVYYVREHDAKKVYTAQVDPSDLSTSFTDYVEVDPLKIKREDVRSMTIADYSVDLKNQNNQLLLRSTTDLKRQGSADAWDATSALPEGKQVAQGVINGILTAVTSIKLTDVMLLRGGADLEGHGIFAVPPGTIQDNSPVLPFMDASGQAKSYEIVGTEGRLDITAKDGLVYSLMFGGAAMSNDAKDKAKNGATDAAKDAAHDRYVVVFVRYVPELDDDAKAEAAKKDAKPDEAKKKDDGAERAAKAQKRFIKYFYVISDDAFKQLRPALDKLFENKPPEPMVGKTGKSVSAWMAENGKRPGVCTTPDGLQYEILAQPRKDGKAPLPSDEVQVHYVGTLLTDGTQFDASQGDKTFTTKVTQVIPAWVETLQLMHEGEKVRIWAKPELAYGSQAKGNIPANSTLVFEIELLKVIGPGVPPKTSALPMPAPAPAPAKPAAPAAK